MESRRRFHINPEDLVLLVERLQQGDPKAKEEMIAIFGVWIHGRIERKADCDNAKDVADQLVGKVQDEICDTVHKLRNPGAFVVWASKVIDNYVLGYFRKERRRERAQVAYVREYAVMHSKTNESTWYAEEWLEKLSPKHARILRMFDIKGMSIKQIAELEGIPEGTVKSRIHYARKALKKVLPEEVIQKETKKK